jgi:hypothetical protein
MRPNPTQPHDADSGRIIYLGNVRRKRSSRRRQAPDRHYLAVIGVIAVAAWAVWLAVLLTLPPSRLLTYLGFFTPMFVGIAAIGALVSYAVDWRRGFYPSLRVSLRRGLLAGALVVTNLAFLAAHRWTSILGLITVAAVVGVEVLMDWRAARAA